MIIGDGGTLGGKAGTRGAIGTLGSGGRIDVKSSGRRGGGLGGRMDEKSSFGRGTIGGGTCCRCICLGLS